MANPGAYYLGEGMPAPAPAIDGLDTEYWEAVKRHDLLVQNCNTCDRPQFGPEWNCHRCHSFDLGWKPVEGNGRIYSWERVWHPVHPALQDSCPYLVVLVELPNHENVRMVGNLVGDPMQTVEIGAEVRPYFEDHAGSDEIDPFTLVHWEVVD